MWTFRLAARSQVGGMLTMISEDFSRVILNLHNAFDANAETSLKLEVGNGKSKLTSPKLTVQQLCKRQKLILSMEITEEGFPREILDKILQPFFHY